MWTVIKKIKWGKAAGLDEIRIHHLIYIGLFAYNFEFFLVFR